MIGLDQVRRRDVGRYDRANLVIFKGPTYRGIGKKDKRVVKISEVRI
jgi:hypothetical protein